MQFIITTIYNTDMVSTKVLSIHNNNELYAIHNKYNIVTHGRNSIDFSS